MTEPTHNPGDPPTMHDIDPPGQIIGVWVAVMVLSAANVGLSVAGLGAIALPVQLIIGLVQAVIVAYYWMHMKRGDQVVTLCALSALFFMFIFYFLVFSDLISRPWGAY
jgi:cytochrome c oxidase subunit 4